MTTVFISISTVCRWGSSISLVNSSYSINWWIRMIDQKINKINHFYSYLFHGIILCLSWSIFHSKSYFSLYSPSLWHCFFPVYDFQVTNINLIIHHLKFFTALTCPPYCNYWIPSLNEPYPNSVWSLTLLCVRCWINSLYLAWDW